MPCSDCSQLMLCLYVCVCVYTSRAELELPGFASSSVGAYTFTSALFMFCCCRHNNY